MPQIEGGPTALNELLENVYNECMKKRKNPGKCSRIAWGAAENAGWHKGKDGKWKKKNEEELKKDALAKKFGIRRKKTE